jgi:hypothetical protein
MVRVVMPVLEAVMASGPMLSHEDLKKFPVCNYYSDEIKLFSGKHRHKLVINAMG